MKDAKFKQTELGQIPTDWKSINLGSIADIRTGKRNGDESEAFGKYPFFVRSQTVYRINSYSFDGEAILIPGEGGIGSIFHYINGKFDYHQRVYKISDFSENFCAKYLFYFMKQYFGPYAMSLTVKATVDSLRLPTFENFVVWYPPLKEEQQRIANALSDVDTLINNLEKLIDKKKNIKQGAMQQLLTGRKRLPGFAPAKPTYKQTELGKIPTDWEFVPVSELAKDMADGPFGSNLKKEHYTSDPQARIIQLSNIGENGWEDENTKYTTFEHAKTIARCIVPKEESILVAKMMPAGRAIICPKKEKQYVLGSDVIRITANEKLNSKYFVYASKSDAYLKQISDNTQGSTRQRTSISKLRKILILLPSLDEQTAIANVLSDMDTEISALETKLAKYRTLKTGMMQQLLTGKIRLI